MPSIRTARELFTTLAPLIDAEITAEIGGSYHSCILATSTACKVARYYGILTRPLAVRAIVANAAFYEYAEQHEDLSDIDAIRANGGHSIGVGYNPAIGIIGGGSRTLARSMNSWAGHLIVTAESLFADFGIRQAERPEHRIFTGPAVIGSLENGDPQPIELADGAHIFYHRTGDNSWKDAPDWNGNHVATLLASRIIRQLKRLPA